MLFESICMKLIVDQVYSTFPYRFVEQVNVPAEVAEAPAPVEETAAAPEVAPEAPAEVPAPAEAPAPVPAIPTREMVAIPEAAPVPETKVFLSHHFFCLLLL